MRTLKEEQLVKEKEKLDTALIKLKAILQEELQCYFDERALFNDA